MAKELFISTTPHETKVAVVHAVGDVAGVVLLFDDIEVRSHIQVWQQCCRKSLF